MRLVLVVEDHPLVGEATSKLLTHGFEDVQVVTCATATSALENLNDARRTWYRVFLDLAVPGAFGLSLAKQVRSIGVASICCVISAFDRQDYVRQLQAWGFLGYMPKSKRFAALPRQTSKPARRCLPVQVTICASGFTR